MPRIAEAFVEIRPESLGFPNEARRQIAAAVSRLEAAVPLHADGRGLRDEVRRATAAAGAGAQVQAQIALAERGAASLRAATAEAARRAGVDVEIGLDVDTGGLRGEVSRAAAAAGADVRIEVTAATEGLSGEISRAASAAGAGIDVELHADAGGLRGEVTRAAAAAGAGQNVQVGVDLDDRNLKSLLASVTGGAVGAAAALKGVVLPAALFQGLAAANSGLVSLAGAALAVVAPLSQLGNVIPALAVGGIALGAGFGVVAGALSGVGDALKAYTSEQKEASTAAAGGGRSALAAARAHEAAAEAVEDATDRVARARESQARDAEQSAESIADAEESVVDAQAAAADSAERSAESIAAAQDRVVESHQQVVDAEERLAQLRQDSADRAAEAQERYAERVEESNEDILRAEEDLAERRIQLAEDVADAQRRLEEGRLQGQERIAAAEQRIRDVRDRAAERDRDRRQRDQDRQRLDAARSPEDRRRIQSEIDAREAREAEADDRKRTQRELADAEADLAKAREDAAEREERDREALAQAQENQARGIEDAEERVNDARKEGLRVQREGQQLARQQAADERRIAEAVRDVEEARKDEGVALAGVARAQEEAARDAVRSQRAVADAVDGLARARRDADRSAADSARSVLDAEKDLERAMRRAGEVAEEAGTTGAASVDKFAQAMEGLSPAAQSFVRSLLEVKGTLKDLRDTAAESLFPGLEAGLRNVTPLLESLDPTISRIGGVIGTFTDRLGALLSGPRSLEAFAQLGGSSARILELLGDAALILIPPLQTLLVAAIPLAETFAKWVVDGAKVFDQFIKGRAASGELAASFERTEGVLRTLGSIATNIGGTLRGVFQAAMPTGMEYLGLLDQATGKLRDLVRSDGGQNGLARFFESSKPLVLELTGLVGDLVKGLGGIGAELAPQLTPIVAMIRTDLVPALLSLVDSIDADFLATLVQLGVSVAKFAAAFFAPTDTLKVMLGLVGELADAATFLLTELGPLSTVLANLASLFTLVGTALAGAAIARKLSEIIGLRKGIDGVTASLGKGGMLGALGLAGAVAVGVYSLGDAIGDMAPSVDRLVREVRGSEDPLKTFNAELANLANPSLLDRAQRGISQFLKGGFIAGFEAIPNAVGAAVSSVKDFGDKSSEAFRKLAQESPKDAIDLVAVSMRNAGQPTAEFERILHELGLGQQFMAAQTAIATQKIDDQVRAQKEARDAHKDAMRAELDMLDATDRYSASLKENGSSHDENTAKGRANIRAREDLLSAVERNIEALLRDAEKNGANAGEVGQLRDRLNELKDKYPELAGELERAATRMDQGLQGIRDKQVYLQVHGVSPENDRTLGTAGDPDARPIGANTGRLVPGTGNSDTVPAWLTPGEFVTRKAVVAEQGTGAFEALNAGSADIVRRYATGGYVHPPGAPRYRLGGAVELHLGLPDIEALLASSEGWVGEQFRTITDQAQANYDASRPAAPSSGGGGSGTAATGSVGGGAIGSGWEAITGYLDSVGEDYTVTSTTGGSHVEGSYHYQGKAVDLVSDDMMRTFNVLTNIGSSLAELFYDPAGWSIKNGERAEWTVGGHDGHVHAATFDQGGWLQPGLTAAYNGTGAPEWIPPPAAGGGGSELRDILLAIKAMAALIERTAGHTHPVEIDGRGAGRALAPHVAAANARTYTSRRRS